MSRPGRSRRGRAPDVGLAAIAVVALSGCSQDVLESTESGDYDEEAVFSAATALQPAACVTVRRGVLGNVHDGFLSGDIPGWQTGVEQSLWTGISSGGNENRLIVKFDLSFLPPYAVVTSATFGIRVSWTPYDTEVRAHEVLVPWSETTISALSFPPGGYSPAVVGSFQTGDQGFRYVDITPLAQGWVDGTKADNGILLEEDPVVAHHYFSSESSLSVRPLLALCYVNGPPPHEGGALVSGGVTSDSESYHFVGSMGEGPGANRVSTSETLRFVGGLVGATQE